MRCLKAFIAIVLALSIVASLFLGGAFIDTTARDTISIAITGTAQAYTADMVCDGIDDHVQWQEAVDNLPNGGKVQDLCGVQYNFGDVVTLPGGNIVIEGLGPSTYFTRDGSNPVFSDGNFTDNLFLNLATDAGGITRNNSNDSYVQDVWINGVYTFEGLAGAVMESAVDDIPVDGATTDPISSNWAYDHNASKDSHVGELLAGLLEQSNYVPIPTNAGWTETNVGSGNTFYEPFRQALSTGTTPNSSTRSTARCFGFNEGGTYYHFDWSEKLYILATTGRLTSDSEFVGRIQLKHSNALGQLATVGVGIYLENNHYYGESYRTARATVDLGVNDHSQHYLVIILDPDESVVTFEIDGVQEGQITGSAFVPSSVVSTNSYIVCSAENGATGGANNYLLVLSPKIWQER